MNVERLAQMHAEWIGEALKSGNLEREAQWSESVAVGRRKFVESVAAELGVRGKYRRVITLRDVHILREGSVAYEAHWRGRNVALRAEIA